MKPRIIFALTCVGIFSSQLLAADKPKPETNPEAGGVIISPGEGEIGAGEELTITFPQPMVDAKVIDVAAQPVPFTSEPKIEGDFLWKSQTEGVFTIRSVVAGAKHRLRLSPGLADFSGKKINAPNWSAEFTTPDFTFSTDFGESEHLSARPQVTLTATYAVQLTEAAEHIYFQDRESRQRLPADAIQTDDEKTTGPPEAKEFSVQPREPLPVGRSYDLIVDGLLDAKSRRPLAYLQVLPLGKTVPLELQWIGAFNHPLEEPSIIVKFTDGIDPAEATPEKVQIEPAVKDAKFLASSDQIEIRGAFDLKQKYRVAVSTELKGERGYGLPKESRWNATFHAKEPAIVFPGSQLYLRARQELRFSFFQVNTPPVTWKLAQIPLEKLAAVSARVREFDGWAKDPLTGTFITDPRTGSLKPLPTEVLVDAFKLQTVSSGTVEATADDKMTQRDIRCAASDGRPISGAYLLEATATLQDGRVVGNRSVVCVSDAMLTQKRTSTAVIMRVTKMSDAQPLSGTIVRAVTSDNIELGRATTDQNGIATFERNAVAPAKGRSAQLFIAETTAGPALQLAEPISYPSGELSTAPIKKAHAEIITDRNLYRPGQTVKMKGIVRTRRGGELAVPPAGNVHWTVTQNGGDRVIAENNSTLTPLGGWEAAWDIPEKAKLGQYDIQCEAGEKFEGAASIRVEEYRVPLFSVVVEVKPEVDTTAHAHVSSEYFHGAPNSGARAHWKATWTASTEYSGTENEKRRYNQFAEVGPRLDPSQELTKTVEGDVKLDGRGHADLACESPFKDNAAISHSIVSWRVEITSAEAQTIVGGEIAQLYSSAARLGVSAIEEPGQSPKVQVGVDAVDPQDKPVKEVAVRVDLFHVTTKTVKEQVAPFVYRYRNTDQFVKVASKETKTPGELMFPVEATGRFVAAAFPVAIKTAIVSDSTTISGEQPAELPVENETAFKIEHREEPFAPGEKAVLSTQAPFAGTAWVSIETDDLLDTILLPIAGNAGRIEIPVKKNYAPNATVSIYLVRPGGEKELPRERFAFTELQVKRPDLELDLTTHLENATVKPGEAVRGVITVKSEDKPVGDAELVICAVDDAVLNLGDWHLPDVLAAFYPKNPYGVRSYQSVSNFIEQIAPRMLTQKGFVIGDGGDEEIGSAKNVRKEFRTLAFWEANAHTDANGQAKFEFEAPDNLTAYRIFAVAQTKAHQFGGIADTKVAVSKPLLVETALPRFLRDGDEVELRAVVRQKVLDSTKVTVRCTTDSSCQLANSEPVAQVATRDTPSVFRFKAKIADAALAPTKIRFEATAEGDAKLVDAVEVTLPVQPPTIIRVESVSGTFAGTQFDARSKIPAAWKTGRGDLGTTISTSPWLPKIAGLPFILEYPHGCFEQISTRLLGYSLLANLLAYLPEAKAREMEYRAVIEKGLKLIDQSVLENGLLPYWPGGDTGHAFVSAEALWAMNESAKANIDVPEEARTKLEAGLRKVIQGQIPAPALSKCFALFVLTQNETKEDFASVAQELFLRRNDMGDEGRALLALALHQQKIMPREIEQLMRELDGPAKERAFNPQTFTSVTRAEAIRALAFNTIAPKSATTPKRNGMRESLLKTMDSSLSLSTQENLWLLLAFRSMLDSEHAEELASASPGYMRSENGRSGAWSERKLADNLVITGLNKGALTFLMKATYSTPELDTTRVDRGFRLERVVRNMTEPKRTGEADAPFKLGDQVLITYRVNTQKLQNYVALEDSLPAGLEVLNPDLAAVGKFFELPPSAERERMLDLSHSEMRDRATLLYFDTVEPGSGTYSILARATAAGTYRWPATQITPMYDSRFSGLTASSVCVVSGE